MLQTRPAFKPAARRTHEDGGLEQHRNPVVIVRNPDREVFVSGKDIPGQQFCRKPYCVDGAESLYLFLFPPVQNEIYIITARHGEQRISTEEIQSITKNWLEENGVIYDKLIFSPEDKLETCLNNKIDVMVEDKPANINKLSTKIPVVCFHSGYNEDCHGDNIYTAYSWYDVYHKIKIIQR